MKQIRFSRKHQKGISLLEVLLSLSIIAIILVMATRYFFVASNNDRVNTTRQQVGSLIAAIRGWKGQNSQYSSSLNVSLLYQNGKIASSNSLKVNGVGSGATATMYDPWGQQITVVGAADQATITVKLPKKSDCVALRNSYPAAKPCADSGTFELMVK